MTKTVVVVLETRPTPEQASQAPRPTTSFTFADAPAAMATLRQRGWMKRLFDRGWDDAQQRRSATIQFERQQGMFPGHLLPSA